MPGGKGYKNKGEIAGIPRNQRAYLMYYLHCVCSILEIDKDKNINKYVQTCAFVCVVSVHMCVLW